MFKNNYEGLSADSKRELAIRFDEFQHGTVLPSWVIRFHGFIPKETDLTAQILGEVKNFRFYKDSDFYYIYRLDNKRLIGIRLARDFSEADVYCGKNDISGEQIDRICELIREGYRYRCVKCNCMMIHASSVIYRNEGILFFGYSGAGKSTQADLWKNYKNALVLNYDQNCIIPIEDRYCVSGTPWGGKEKYYYNGHVPIRAIVYVQKSLEGNSIVRLNRSNAFSVFVLHNYLFALCPEIEEKYYDVIISIVKDIPIYILYCLNNEEAVNVLHEELYCRNYKGENENGRII